MRLEVSTEIAAPPEQVWAVLSDVERMPEWTASMTRVRRLDEGPLAVGSTVRVEQPRLRPATWRVTQYDPGRSFTWQSTSGGVTTVASHELVSHGDAVRVTLIVQQTGLLAALVGLLAGSLTRRYIVMEAEGLKRRCEQGRDQSA
ncbi:MAG TPA: SRPBCC family protein [Micromonospora sp.]|nr:SRPBCC family protein [Micromonospora sp.]